MRPPCYENFSQEQLRILLPIRLELCLLLLLSPHGRHHLLLLALCVDHAHPAPYGAQKRHPSHKLATRIAPTSCCALGPITYPTWWGSMKASPKWRREAVVFGSLNASLDPFLFYFSLSSVAFQVVWERAAGTAPSAPLFWGRRCKGNGVRPRMRTRRESSRGSAEFDFTMD